MHNKIPEINEKKKKKSNKKRIIFGICLICISWFGIIWLINFMKEEAFNRVNTQIKNTVSLYKENKDVIKDEVIKSIQSKTNYMVRKEGN